MIVESPENVQGRLRGAQTETRSCPVNVGVRDWSVASRVLAVCTRRVPPGRQAEESLWMLLGSVPLVKYGPRPDVRGLRNLLTGNSSATWGGGYSEKSTGVRSKGRDGAAPESSAMVQSKDSDFISFWKPEVSLTWKS